MSTAFFHGVQGFITRVEGRPITAIRSSIIGLVVSAGKGPVNVPTLIFGNLSQAYTLFGPALGDGFTAGQSIKSIFDQIGTLVVVVNVCDPAVHKTVIASELVSIDSVNGKGKTAKRYLVPVGNALLTTTTAVSAPVTLNADGEWDVPAGVAVTGVKSAKGGSVIAPGAGVNQWEVSGGKLAISGAEAITVWVSYTATLVLGTDYTVDGDLGQVTRLNTSSRLLPGADITVGYTYVDPTKVTEADVIGAPQVGLTKATGIYGLRAAPTAAGVLAKPRILIAPGFSDKLAVGQALDTAARVLNGRAILDAPNEAADALEYRLNFAGETNRSTIHYPNYFITHPTNASALIEVGASAHLAGLQARVDKIDGKGNPYVSLSNKSINGIAALTRAVDYTVVNIGETDGESSQQHLNENNIVTTIREGGWRAYGNTQANGEFLCVMRMADYVLESAALALVWAIDRAINNNALLDQLLTQVRHFLRALEQQGALVANPDPDNDNDVWFPPELNTPDQTALGLAYLNFRMNPPPPLQRLTVTGELTHEFVRRLFTENNQ